MSAASLQFPRGLVLSEASAPITAMFFPFLASGKTLFSFFNKTIDFLARSSTSLKLLWLPITDASRASSQYLYGSSKSPNSNLTLRILLAASLIKAGSTFPSFTSDANSLTYK